MEWLHPTTNLNKLGMATFLIALSFFRMQAQNAIKDSVPYIDPHTFFILLEAQHPDLSANIEHYNMHTPTTENGDLSKWLIETIKTKRQKRKSERRKKRHEQ